jgi:hypothetical protein
MVKDVPQVLTKSLNSAKLTINLGFFDLGHIAVTVRNGFAVAPKLAREAAASVEIVGAFHTSLAVKAALADPTPEPSH